MIRRASDRWSTLGEWLALVQHVGRQIRPSTKHYDRCRQLYRALNVTDIRDCVDADALERLATLLDAQRYDDAPLVYGLRREIPRESLGAMLVEARNQILRVRSGRIHRPRVAGPRFDPAFIPDAALVSLIQRHPDLAVVDRLRAERARRLEAA